MKYWKLFTSFCEARFQFHFLADKSRYGSNSLQEVMSITYATSMSPSFNTLPVLSSSAVKKQVIVQCELYQDRFALTSSLLQFD